MRTYTLVLLSVLCLLSCNISKEDKAKSLIAEEVKKTLISPDSYDPIETKIDSAFSPIDDPHLIAYCMEVGELAKKLLPYIKQQEIAKTTMSIWSDSYSTYARNEYNKAKKEYEEATEILKNDSIKNIKKFEEVAKKIDKEKHFVGYKAIHSYRFKNNSQEIRIDEAIVFLDKDMQKIRAMMPKESYAYLTYTSIIEIAQNSMNSQ